MGFSFIKLYLILNILLFLIQSQITNHPGGISMPIGFIKTEEIEDESWINELIQHILSCLAMDCERCRTAAENNFLGFLKTR